MNQRRAIVSADWLKAHITDPVLRVVDCRHDLSNPDYGWDQYQQAHIPGARFASIDRDLSDLSDLTKGRHPLPSTQDALRCFKKLGIQSENTVIIYDQQQGMYAARLWWMLRFFGEKNVFVLDGGFLAWQEKGFPTTAAIPDETRTEKICIEKPNLDMLVTLDQLMSSYQEQFLIDSRASDRYAGHHEPIDKKAGHIPGAINRCWEENLESKKIYFKPQNVLKKEFIELLGEHKPEQSIFYCGSGISACHNLLAMEHASLPIGKLYAGSWSEWSNNHACPVEV